MSKAARFSAALALVAACDVTSTIGFNDRAPSVLGGDGGDASQVGTSTPLACGAETDLAVCSADTSGCVVRELFSAELGRLSIAVDDDAYYYMGGADVLIRRPKAGGDPAVLATGYQMSHFVIDATHVYWTEYSSGVGRVAKTGGPREQVTAPFGHPDEIVIDDDYVYCALPEEGEIVMARKLGGPVTKITGQARPTGLARDATHLYWTNRGAGSGEGQLVRTPLGDLTQPEVVVSNLDAPLRLTIDGDDAIVAEEAGSVRRMPKSGGDVSVVTTGFVEPKAVGAFRGRVYIAGMSGLVSVPASGGGAPAVLESRPVIALTLGCEGAHGLVWHSGEFVRYGK